MNISLSAVNVLSHRRAVPSPIEVRWGCMAAVPEVAVGNGRRSGMSAAAGAPRGFFSPLPPLGRQSENALSLCTVARPWAPCRVGLLSRGRFRRALSVPAGGGIAVASSALTFVGGRR